MLRSALDGDTRLLLVVGDAGVGKTLFVTEGLGSTGAQRPSAWGACLPLAEQLPLLPVAEALDALSRLKGGALLEGALDSAPAYARTEAGRLLPQLQAPGAAADGLAGGWQRQRMFAGVAELMAAAARPAGLVVVIEDVHWADGATLDFLTFLAGAGRSAAVTVVATCRSDEAPLEPHVTRWLAHVRGSGAVAEIRLPPLSRQEVAQQVTALMGGMPPAGVADELYARGEGNPFFTEQLVLGALSGPAAGELPDRLAQLLIARVGGCGDDASSALAALAVAGRPLSEEQLRAVSGLSAAALPGAIRELATTRLLSDDTGDERYRARHALLGEAVAAALLQGERLMLHERTARVLQADGETLAAEAADHWAAAGQPAAELPARVTAAEAAERVFGYAEAASHWQRAIELYEARPEAGPGMDVAQMYIRAIDALHVSGDVERAGALAEQAYRRCAGHPDPLINAIVHERAARFRNLADAWLGGRHTPGSGLELATEALRLFEQEPPSAEHAEALFYYGNFLYFGLGQDEEHRRALERGLEIAEVAHATAQIPRILALLQHPLFRAGQVDEAFATLHRGRELAEAAGDAEALMQLDTNESDALLKLGRFQDAYDTALRGGEAARHGGLDEYWNAAIVFTNAGEALIHQGRTAEAAELIDPLTAGPPDRDHWLLYLYRAELDMLRGDIEAALRRQQQVSELAGNVSNFDWSREAAQRIAELQLWAGKPDRALGEVSRRAGLFGGSSWAIYCGRLLTAGMRACADLADRARARKDGAGVSAAQGAGDELERVRAGMAADPFADHPASAAIPAERSTWTAERSRLAGASDPVAWRAAARAWAGLGSPHRAGYAWWRLAEAELNAGHARDAAAALQAAAEAAQGHAPLLAEVGKLAARARIPLPAAPTASAGTAKAPDEAGTEPSQHGLTSRELDVLRLLAAGCTNAEIGAELFISPKTASVHVTSILRKLGVSGRVQAAAAAERAGLLDPSAPQT